MEAEQVPIPISMGRVELANVLLKLLSLCKVCSTEQIGRLYGYCSQPNRRAWELVKYLRENDYIESRRRAYDESMIHRLSKRIRKQYGLRAPRWDARVEHKLAITDVYLDLGMPDDFLTEYRQRFVWRGKTHTLSPDACAQGMFIEVQRTPIETRDWAEKRRLYELYFMGHMWEGVFGAKPMVVIVQTHNQQLSTIGAGIGYDLQVVSHICEVAHHGD